MSAPYFAILTAIGEAKLANATILGTTLQLTHLAVGDGNGIVPVPDRTQRGLANEQRRAPLNTLKVDPHNPNQIIAEQVLPEEVGGWWIRELGLYDKDGNLCAVANCPPSYKPQLAEGSGRTQIIRMVLIVSSTSAVELRIDPSVVLATRQYTDDQRDAHTAAVDPHPQYLTEPEGNALVKAAVNKLVGGATAALDTLAELATALGNDADFAGSVANALSQKAPLASPALTDIPTAPTAALGTCTAQLATTAYVMGAQVGIVGSCRGLRAHCMQTDAVLAFELSAAIVETSAGMQYRFSGTTTPNMVMSNVGINGMDTGLPPSSGYVAIYLIFNPATASFALLGQDATNTARTEMYTGNAMPDGYTASCLLSIWPTHANRNFGPGLQVERTIYKAPATQFAGSATTGTITMSGAPPNARAGGGTISAAATGSVSCTMSAGISSLRLGEQITQGQGFYAAPWELAFDSARRLTYAASYTSAPFNMTVTLSRYNF